MDIIHDLQDSDDDNVALECETLLNLIDKLQDSRLDEEVNDHQSTFNEVYKQVWN